MATSKRDLRPEELFLYCLAAYVVILLNQHFNVPLKFLPFILLLAGSAIYTFTAPRPLVGAGGLSTDLAAAGLLIAIFFAAAVSAGVGLSQLLTTVVGPAALAVLAGVMLPPQVALRVLAAACVGALLFLATTDVLHYGRDFWRDGGLPAGPSHRWFADGYVFFLPWLFVVRDTARTVWARWLLRASMVGVFFLLAGTGSRAAWGAVAVEIVMLALLLRRPRYLLDLLLFAGVLVLAAPMFQTASAAFERGFDDNQRLRGTWRPGFQLISQNLWLGHGFGHEAWNLAYRDAVRHHPEWAIGAPLGGPHNVFLSVVFASGLAGLAAFLLFVAVLLAALHRAFARSLEPERTLAAGVLCALVAFYFIYGLVGDPRLEPLWIVFMWALLLKRAALLYTRVDASF
jgi:O-antigen ligase